MYVLAVISSCSSLWAFGSAFLCTAKALGKLSCIPFSLILKVEDVIFSSLEAYSLNSFNGVYTLLKPLFEYAGLLVQLILAIFLLSVNMYNCTRTLHRDVH